MQITVGTKVTWKASGKGARCDGVAGRMVTGTVTALNDDVVPGEIWASVKGDYPSMFSGHAVPVKSLRIAR